MLIEPSPEIGNIPFDPKDIAKANLPLVVRSLTEDLVVKAHPEGSVHANNLRPSAVQKDE